MEVLQRTANRGSVSTGYDIDNSLKFEADNSEYLKWTDISTYATSARKKTFSFSVWFKINELGVQRTIWSTASNGYLLLQADGQLKWQQSYGGVVKTLNTNRLFRDTSAWYNVIIAVDSTQSTEANRVRLYVNGVEETSLTSTTYPSQNAEAENVYENHHSLGAYNSSSIFWSGYMANVAFISDAQITPSDVGEFDDDTGIWIPKAYSGGSAPSYFLEFKDSSDLGTATGLDADTLNNIAAADQATDTPTNNFATMNVLWGTNRMPLMSEGATEFGNNVNDYRYAPATMGVANGKWYWEIKPTVNGNTLVSGAGIASNQETLFFYQTTGNFVYHYDGDRYVNGGASSFGAAWATNDIIGFAYDADNWTLTCYVNNSSQGNLLASQTDISSELFIPYVYSFGTHTYQTNFGGYTTMSNTHTNTDGNGYGSFVYAPPSGYYALCTKNLAEYG